ncbi:MAG TPA: hypothetical protein VD813_03225 [Pseudonocardia sp.]|nr:hypothetical protein [Pseudonocardia sp.]
MCAFATRAIRAPGSPLTRAHRLLDEAVTALADLPGLDRVEARRRVTAADHVCPRATLDGAPLPARLPPPPRRSPPAR